VNLTQLFAIARERNPERVALEELGPDGLSRETTFAALHDEAARLAAGFQSLGLGQGERVAFYLGNRREFAVAYLAVLRLGAVMVPINLAYRRREIAHILHDAEPRFLLSERAHEAALGELEGAERGTVERVLWAEDLAGWSIEAPVAPANVGGDDLALLMYTSGTTGRSKGAMLSHDNLLATITGLLAAWDWRAADSLLLSLPLFHTHGLVVGLHCALAAGATTQLRRRFDAAHTVTELAAGAATLFFGVPTMYVRLVEELRRTGAGPDLRRLRLFCSGSAPLAPETFDAFAALTGHRILERYGMTETGMLLSNRYATAAGERRAGTVGFPLPGVSVEIVDASGNGVPDGGEGELLVAGSNVFSGYWRAPEKTAESFTVDAARQRWFHTGDLARRDPGSGHVTLLGRRTELILCGGFNVYPREIEELLESHPAIREAAVVGRPHAEWGEVPVAFVVPRQAVVEAEVIAWCKGQLAGFKAPRAIHVLETLPRNALGKVQKHLLPRDAA